MIVSTMSSMLGSYRERCCGVNVSKRRDIHPEWKHGLMIASVFAGASITIWYDSTVVDVSVNFERFPLIHSPFVT